MDYFIKRYSFHLLISCLDRKISKKWWMTNLYVYTGCPKSPVPISFLNISTILFGIINYFFSNDRGRRRVFIHTKKLQNYCSKVSLLTELQKWTFFYICIVLLTFWIFIFQLKCNQQFWKFHHKLFSSCPLCMQSFRPKLECWIFYYIRLPWFPSGSWKNLKILILTWNFAYM